MTWRSASTTTTPTPTSNAARREQQAWRLPWVCLTRRLVRRAMRLLLAQTGQRRSSRRGRAGSPSSPPLEPGAGGCHRHHRPPSRALPRHRPARPVCRRRSTSRLRVRRWPVQRASGPACPVRRSRKGRCRAPIWRLPRPRPCCRWGIECLRCCPMPRPPMACLIRWLPQCPATSPVLAVVCWACLKPRVPTLRRPLVILLPAPRRSTSCRPTMVNPRRAATAARPAMPWAQPA